MEGHAEEDGTAAGALVLSQKQHTSQQLSLPDQLAADFRLSPQVLLPYIAPETETISFADARDTLLRALRTRGMPDQALAERFLHLEAVLEQQLSLLQVEEELLSQQRLLIADVAAALRVEGASVAGDEQESDWRDAARKRVERYEAAKLRLARMAQRWAGWSDFGLEECAPYGLRATTNSVMSVIKAFGVVANLDTRDEQLPNEKFLREEIRERWSDLLDVAVGEARGAAVGPAALKRAVDALKRQDAARRHKEILNCLARKNGTVPQRTAQQVPTPAAQQQRMPPANDSLRGPRSPTPPPSPHASNASTPRQHKPLTDSPQPSACHTSSSPQPPTQLDDNPLTDQITDAEPRSRPARENRTAVQTYHEGRSAPSSRRRLPAKRALSPESSQLDADDENAPPPKPPKRAKQVQPNDDLSDDEGAAGSNDAGNNGGGIGQREEEESAVRQASTTNHDRPPAADSGEAEDEGEDEGEEEDQEPEAKDAEVDQMEKGLSDGETGGTQVSSGEGEQALHAQVKESNETSPADSSATETDSDDSSKRLRFDAGVASTRAKSLSLRSPPRRPKPTGTSDVLRLTAHNGCAVTPRVRGHASSDELGNGALDSDDLDSSTSPRDRVRTLERRIVSLKDSLQIAAQATSYYQAKYRHYRAKARSRGVSVSPTDSSVDEGPPGPASPSATRQDAASPEMRSQTQRIVKPSLKLLDDAVALPTEDRVPLILGKGAENRVPAAPRTAKATASRAARPLRAMPSLANSPTRPTRPSAPAPAPTLPFTSSKSAVTFQKPFKPPSLLRPPRSTCSPPRNPPAAASLSAFTYAPALPAALATSFDPNSLSPDLARLSFFHEDAPALNWFVSEKLLDVFSESDACVGLAGMFEMEEDDQVKFGDYLSPDTYDWDDEDERGSREWTVGDCRSAPKGWVGDFGMFNKEIDVVSAKGKTWTVQGEEVAKRELERALRMIREEAEAG